MQDNNKLDNIIFNITLNQENMYQLLCIIIIYWKHKLYDKYYLLIFFPWPIITKRL